MRTNAEMSISLLLLIGVFVASTSAAGFGSDDDESADYYRGHESSGHNSNNNKLPAILMHKQALQQDGGFQYAFAADNGLRQGESIRPDGSRIGAYSYTDPNGKEISVKYSAGKDGFRILEGDHVPKAPVSAVPYQQQPGATYAPQSSARSSYGKNRLFGAPGGPGSQFSRGRDSNSAAKLDHSINYSGESFVGTPLPYKSKFSKPQQHYRVREENSAELAARYEDDRESSALDGAGDYSSHSPFRAPSSPARATRYNGASAEGSANDDSSSDGNDRQPHTFGSGYAFEFGATNNGPVAVSAEFLNE